jgi:hypothetical protein
MTAPTPVIRLVAAGGEEVVSGLELLAEVSKHSLDLRLRVSDLLQRGVEPVCVDSDRLAASGAGDVLIRFQFSDPFAELVAAVRAGKFNG